MKTSPLQFDTQYQHTHPLVSVHFSMDAGLVYEAGLKLSVPLNFFGTWRHCAQLASFWFWSGGRVWAQHVWLRPLQTFGSRADVLDVMMIARPRNYKLGHLCPQQTALRLLFDLTWLFQCTQQICTNFKTTCRRQMLRLQSLYSCGGKGTAVKTRPPPVGRSGSFMVDPTAVNALSLQSMHIRQHILLICTTVSLAFLHDNFSCPSLRRAHKFCHNAQTDELQKVSANATTHEPIGVVKVLFNCFLSTGSPGQNACALHEWWTQQLLRDLSEVHKKCGRLHPVVNWGQFFKFCDS